MGETFSEYVIEIQTNADGTGGVLPYGFSDHGAAESRYLALREVARASSVLIHTVIWISNTGHCFERKSYTHPVEAEPAEPAGEAE